MNRFVTSLTISMLLFVGAASAQYNGQKVTVTLPFEFVVGKSTLLAGQYAFLRTATNTLLIRDAQGRSVATVITSPAESSAAPATARLRFANIGGSHVLVQVWNEHEGSELFHAQALLQEARYPAIHGNSAGRR